VYCTGVMYCVLSHLSRCTNDDESVLAAVSSSVPVHMSNTLVELLAAVIDVVIHLCVIQVYSIVCCLTCPGV